MCRDAGMVFHHAAGVTVEYDNTLRAAAPDSGGRGGRWDSGMGVKITGILVKFW